MLVGYDRIAEEFNAARQDFLDRETPYFSRLLSEMRPRSNILDAGCGTGTPVTKYCIDHGHRVTGFDPSAKLIEIAQASVPAGRFSVADMLSFSTSEQFDAVIAWDSIFFVSPDRHGEVFSQFQKWLIPGGMLLCSLGPSGGQFTAVMFGNDFTFGALPAEESRQLLENLGFEILVWEIDDPSSRGHLAVMARRKS